MQLPFPIPAITVRAAIGQSILPHKVRHASRLTHGIIKMTHGGGQLAYFRLTGHGEHECTEHGAADNVRFEAVSPFELGQSCNNLPIVCLGFSCSLLCGICVETQYRRQLRLK